LDERELDLQLDLARRQDVDRIVDEPFARRFDLECDPVRLGLDLDRSRPVARRLFSVSTATLTAIAFCSASLPKSQNSKRCRPSGL
jgi:hypothetical protein